NGKTTTTRLTAAALGVLGPVATNSYGANMPTGHTSALAKAGETPYAVLEVDEHYLPQVLAATGPKVIALLNLSPDQPDRAKAVVAPDGSRHVAHLQLPGRVNRANAATALAVAAQFGVAPADALPHLAEVASIAGRYAQVDREGRAIRLLLAKNPAGWLEAFDMADQAPTLLSINARDPDGLDTS